ncbi:MAG: pyruvate dehydrogenase (acetyl-transferring), homodimeric type [Gammaproteobacteria bacterium]|nr:pyruvate dehydrogenase (acetyl-transferring), homodimeric type [Gammaproteobacteria bacterium]
MSLELANYKDVDPDETHEWQEAVDVVIERYGADRAQFLIRKTIDSAHSSGVQPPDTSRTPYLNTIPVATEPQYPGDHELEAKIYQAVRWNAVAMVVAANRKPGEPGGHIASFQSSAVLYETGFNHFWRGADAESGADMIFVQGHSAPGIYARAFLEGRLSEEQLQNYRREVAGKGVSSYPHPWLMPDFWQFPTVSMGLGPILAIYQARFMKYMQNRGLVPRTNRKVWAFLGDGEMDEPESQGAIALAVREKLDNLVFVINCNLQRLDGPVRGNSKIIQELEGNFRGAGWNVIKVVWGAGWDKLLAQDHNGLLRKRMEECIDGEYQNFKAKGGGYIREHFFGKYPELKKMVEHMSDDEIYYELVRGGHDPQKVHAAYDLAMRAETRPTLILAKTVKGYGMGEAGEGQNITHQQKKLAQDQLEKFARRFDIPVTEDHLANASLYKPADDAPEMKYLHERRKALGGYLPGRRRDSDRLSIPDLSLFSQLLTNTGERAMSTTMALVRCLVAIARNKDIGPRLVPIVPDEARTFGMEGMFRQIGIYAPGGQLYTPMDAQDIMPYKESKTGQLLQEGINEAGAMSSWCAAATAYTNYGLTMMPFYIFYSMFGFQRIGDLAWAAGDMRARGFLVGGTAGRTTLNGEGLQHEDGHSQLFAEYIPSCVSYDPTFHYEVAVIVHDGMRRMFADQEDVFYYLTTMNENYAHPDMPEDAEEGILKGLYRLQEGAGKKAAKRVQLLGSGTILREAMAAAELLGKDFGVVADVWSAPSFNELARDGRAVERWNRLHPDDTPKESWVERCLKDTGGPIVAATDYKRTFAEQIRAFVPRRYSVLGTDGYGRSDSREALRNFFEVDRYHIVVAALKALADDGDIPMKKVSEAIKKYEINPDAPNPATV